MFPGIVQWLDQLTSSPGSCYAGVLDLGRLGVAGHSRGGKLATLVLAGGSQLQLPGFAAPFDQLLALASLWSARSIDIPLPQRFLRSLPLACAHGAPYICTGHPDTWRIGFLIESLPATPGSVVVFWPLHVA